MQVDSKIVPQESFSVNDNIRWYSFRGFFVRAKRSRLFSMFFYENDNVSVDEVDLIVNTITLVNALILTVPFGIMTSLSSSSMDEFKSNVLQCLVEEETSTQTGMRFKTQSDVERSIEEQYFWMTKSTLVSVYVPLISLILAVLYYLVRPSKGNNGEENKEFSEWWKRGRFIVFKLFIGMVLYFNIT